MSLYRVHTVVIIAAILMGALTSVWGLYTYFTLGGQSHLLTGGLSAVAALCLVRYLRWFRNKIAKGE